MWEDKNMAAMQLSQMEMIYDYWQIFYLDNDQII